MADRRPLMNESGDLSDTTPATTPALPSLGFSPQTHSLGFGYHGASHPDVYVSPPTSPPRSRFARPGYERLQSDATAVDSNATAGHEGDRGGSRSASGLGIGPVSPPMTHSKSASVQTLPKSILTKNPYMQNDIVSPLGTGNSLFGGFPNDSTESTPDLRRARFSPDVNTGQFNGSQHHRSGSGDYQRYLHSSDGQKLRNRKSAMTMRSAYESDFRPTEECPTARDFHLPRFSWVAVCLLAICLFSCVFSGIFLGLAIKAPRFGRAISSQGSFKPSDAILLTSVMAKLIELSFVTTFVAFLGQVLSRRAFMKEQGRGVTLSEMSMWRWVVQPGTLITHWETAKYAGLSILGILSLLSAVLATLYTSAASAVVQPMLKEGRWDSLVLAGQVESNFANIYYVKKMCETPIRSDKVDGQTTCLQIEHAGQGFHNYQRYLAHWNGAVANASGQVEQSQRPQGFGLLHENTTVTGQWVDIINTTEVSNQYRRAINNVSLAMPHAGVSQAALDPRNGIMQPEELDSEGTYTLRASVASPVLNVLCASMTEDELKPIVYQSNHPDEPVNGTSWNLQKDFATDIPIATVVDNLFGWNNETIADYPPIFARLPKPFNTILNNTSIWGRDSIYLLGQGGLEDTINKTGMYVLCKIKVTISPNCSTHYTATGSGGSMDAHCEDPADNLAYIKSEPLAPHTVPLVNWKDIGTDWSNSLSLNTGIDDANASNSRLLTQLILQPQPAKDDPQGIHVELNPELPSVAESIAVLSGSTLLKSMQGAPFIHFWNYTEATAPQGMLQTPVSQYFNASLRAQQYASGGPDGASRGWIIILLLVFLMNILVLTYFLFHNGLVTDFSEPPNLFALAVNSPPSRTLEGSCGGGPHGEQFKVNWFIGNEGGHLYMEPGEKPVPGEERYGEPGLNDHFRLHGNGGGHGHGHFPGMGHAHTHGQYAHVHTNSGNSNIGGGVMGGGNRGGEGGGGGFISTLKSRYEKLRERGIRSHQTRMRPVSAQDNTSPVLGQVPKKQPVVQSNEMNEMSPGFTATGPEGERGSVEFEELEIGSNGDENGTRNNRTSRMYETLAKRRSML